MPFGCSHHPDLPGFDEDSCELSLEMHVPNQDKTGCNGHLTTHFCHLDIGQSHWAKTIPMRIHWQDTDKYELSNNVFRLQMKTKIIHELWNDVLLPEIQVNDMLLLLYT